MLDTRREVRRILGSVEPSNYKTLSKLLLALTIALGLAFVPPYTELSFEGRWALFIMVFAALLWVTEALPAFAVALIVIALEIATLGQLGGGFAEAPENWQRFVEPWASPLIWLFLSGFILAHVAAKSGLDRSLAQWVLSWCGKRPAMILLGIMGVTFLLSMFMSNTATAAMMISIVLPIVSRLQSGNQFRKALLLGVPFAANIGGMGTIIGSPPNAIAVGALSGIADISFLDWMIVGLPLALVLLLGVWLLLLWMYPSSQKSLSLQLAQEGGGDSLILAWKQAVVVITFFVTVGLWLTSALHGIPTPVISFIPIALFATFHLLDTEDIRQLNWDVLLLMAGGLSLGVAVVDTGLASWLAGLIPTGGLGVATIALLFAYMTVMISNVMSNTAAANILIPLGLAVAIGSPAVVVIAIAIAASSAMALPIATPPNAIAYASGALKNQDFLKGGVIIGAVVPLLALAWLLALQAIQVL